MCIYIYTTSYLFLTTHSKQAASCSSQTGLDPGNSWTVIACCYLRWLARWVFCRKITLALSTWKWDWWYTGNIPDTRTCPYLHTYIIIYYIPSSQGCTAALVGSRLFPRQTCWREHASARAGFPQCIRWGKQSWTGHLVKSWVKVRNS